MISVIEAFELIEQSVRPLPPENVDLADASGRILADEITSDVDSPPHDKSVMDGFAVLSSDVAQGHRRLEVVETIVAGSWPQKELVSGQAARIMTGAPLPLGADAVVMVENTEFDSRSESGETDAAACVPQTVTLLVDELQAGKHIMRRAASMARGETVFLPGHRIRPCDIGLLAEVGASPILVGRRPSVAVLPTGDELVDCRQTPGNGQIRNSNGPMLASLAAHAVGSVVDLGIGRDNAGELRSVIERGLQHDVLLLSGGVSAGLMDLVPGILADLGVREIFHKVHVKPGKPIWFGMLEGQCYVFGLPGNPVSSLVGFHLFVRSALNRLMGAAIERPKSVLATLVENHSIRGGRSTYWPGIWRHGNESVRRVEPLQWQGSSDLKALGRAEVLIYFPADRSEYKTGNEVEVLPLE